MTPNDLDLYCDQHTHAEPELLQQLMAETERDFALARMLSGRQVGRMLALLVRLLQPQRVLEIGTFTGYSALSMAEALPDTAELHTCDLDPVATAVAQKYFAQSPYGQRIQLHLGPALESLAQMQCLFDFAFIDADKQQYPAYYEQVLARLRPGGVMVFDNCLWSGRVLAPQDEESRAIAQVNRWVVDDPRVENAMLPVRDGVNLIRKRD